MMAPDQPGPVEHVLHSILKTQNVSDEILLPHHGMVLLGPPSSEPALHQTTSGGTPYGPSHHFGAGGEGLSHDEKARCRAFGTRLARTALALSDAAQ
jgi:NAD(P)H dehydrogenase (quinone)